MTKMRNSLKNSLLISLKKLSGILIFQYDKVRLGKLLQTLCQNLFKTLSQPTHIYRNNPDYE